MIVLASKSPRRRELMARVAPDFVVHDVDVDEASVRESDPARFAREAAKLKARAGGDAFPSAIVIGADTVVAVGGRILGKPAGREEARAMLRALSGRRHRVITGVALYRKEDDKLLAAYELTWVFFRPLSDAAIEAYLDREAYRDKAGAYAIQDIGDAFVDRVKGDYDNIVGFPVAKVRTLLARFLAPEPLVPIEDLDLADGTGLGRLEGRTLHVKGALPGDTARVRVLGGDGKDTWADLVRIESPSPLRTAPACPHFGPCGGCLYQDLAYGEQLRLKERFVRRALRETGGLDLDRIEVSPIAPSPDVYDYRNKMEYSFGEAGDGIALGLRERAAEPGPWRRTLPLRVCPIFSPVVEDFFPAVLEFVRAAGLKPYSYAARSGSLRHIILREAKRTGRLMAVLVTTAEAGAAAPGLAETLAARFPSLRSFYHIETERATDVVTYEGARLVAGEPFIEETLGGLTFRIRPATFFQTNTAGAELLYRRLAAAADVGPGDTVLGLYCGSGPIEIFLAAAGARVTGIDSSPANIANAVENALSNGIENAAFVPGSVEKVLRPMPGNAPDLLVIDPPRAGLTPKAMKHVLAAGARRILYVSCRPSSLARDLRALTGHGYSVRSIAPFDFFPHTPHVETLVVLDRAAPVVG